MAANEGVGHFAVTEGGICSSVMVSPTPTANQVLDTLSSGHPQERQRKDGSPHYNPPEDFNGQVTWTIEIGNQGSQGHCAAHSRAHHGHYHKCRQ